MRHRITSHPNKRPVTLHQAVALGDLDLVRVLTRTAEVAKANGINERVGGLTPLMIAVTRTAATPEIVGLLLGAGANPNVGPKSYEYFEKSTIEMAVRAGDPRKVKCLVDAGVSLLYRSEHGYNAALNAAQGYNSFQNERLVELLRLLIQEGVDLNAQSTYGETPLTALSRIGRFDAVQLLVLAGANATPLKWTELCHAVACGTEDTVGQLVAKRTSDLETRDGWSRTPWLLAIQRGNIKIAEQLEDAGANVHATGHCGKTALAHAIECNRLEMVAWLLQRGFDMEGTDEFGYTALTTAIECNDKAVVKMLIERGANVSAQIHGRGVLADARDPEIVAMMLDAGADPADISKEAKRAMCGLQPDPAREMLDVSEDEYNAGRDVVFGKHNPEIMRKPFWIAMIRSGVNAFTAMERFGDLRDLQRPPVWCAERFGQSLTILPDGRKILVGGEHEDFYDPDFCIYNDVHVHDESGQVTILGYPEHIFPPTDFHTATLIGRRIWLVGGLGYSGQRKLGTCQVFTLDTTTFKIQRVETTGEGPGWLSNHRAILRDDGHIEVSGGKVCVDTGSGEDYVDNTNIFVLSPKNGSWARTK